MCLVLLSSAITQHPGKGSGPRILDVDRRRCTFRRSGSATEPRFFTAEIACLRADPHRQAESAEPEPISPSLGRARRKRVDSQEPVFLEPPETSELSPPFGDELRAEPRPPRSN